MGPEPESRWETEGSSTGGAHAHTCLLHSDGFRGWRDSLPLILAL